MMGLTRASLLTVLALTSGIAAAEIETRDCKVLGLSTRVAAGNSEIASPGKPDGASYELSFFCANTTGAHIGFNREPTEMTEACIKFASLAFAEPSKYVLTLYSKKENSEVVACELRAGKQG